MELKMKKALVIALILLIAVVCFFPIAKAASSPEQHAKTIEKIDDKIATVLKLTAASTLASAGVSAIPDDTATPIAEKLADFSEYFLVILCVLYAEKYLLTIIGFGVFKIVFPVACLILIACVVRRNDGLQRVAVKLLVAGLLLFLVIPVSIRASDMIDNVYQASIEKTISAAEELSDETLSLSQAGGDTGLLSRILEGISETISTLTDKAAQILNRFIEALAVMIATSCLIPLIVLLFFLWAIKTITGYDIELPARRRRPGFVGREPGEGR